MCDIPLSRLNNRLIPVETALELLGKHFHICNYLGKNYYSACILFYVVLILMLFRQACKSRVFTICMHRI